MDVGGVRRKPKDYLEGYIKQDGETVCKKVFGTYMGYIDFDGQRFWDARHMDNYKIEDLPLDQSLTSDSRNRPDIINLGLSHVEVA